MSPVPVRQTDAAVLDLLRRTSSCSIAEMAKVLGVTATAVRQRLNRLMAGGLVQRRIHRAGRGRPSHAYALSELGQRAAGADFGDLAHVLWEELRSVADLTVRRGLLRRLAARMVQRSGGRVAGGDLAERMDSLAKIYSDRQVPFEVDHSGELPVIRALACPYPGLAEEDRGVCAMERMFLGEMLGEEVRLSGCRLDGDSCCTFQPSGT